MINIPSVFGNEYWMMLENKAVKVVLVNAVSIVNNGELLKVNKQLKLSVLPNYIYDKLILEGSLVSSYLIATTDDKLFYTKEDLLASL